MFEPILYSLEALVRVIPIELFVILGAFIEEIIMPIPSPLVMVLAGSIAQAQNQVLWYLVVLALLGAVGKTIGAWILYVLSDKLEDFFFGRFGKYLGISHKEVESVGKKLKGGWQDYVFLFFARAVPIIPSAPVSIACGIIKVNLKVFLLTTFTGTVVRNIMYLYLGYVGLGNYKEISQGFSSYESMGQMALFLVIGAVVAWAYYKRRKSQKAEENEAEVPVVSNTPLRKPKK